MARNSVAVWLAVVVAACLASGAAAVCGDGYCDSYETCATCAGDCGPCQPYGAVHSCRDPHAFALTFDDGPAAPYVGASALPVGLVGVDALRSLCRWRVHGRYACLTLLP